MAITWAFLLISAIAFSILAFGTNQGLVQALPLLTNELPEIELSAMEVLMPKL